MPEPVTTLGAGYLLKKAALAAPKALKWGKRQVGRAGGAVKRRVIDPIRGVVSPTAKKVAPAAPKVAPAIPKATPVIPKIAPIVSKVAPVVKKPGFLRKVARVVPKAAAGIGLLELGRRLAGTPAIREGAEQIVEAVQNEQERLEQERLERERLERELERGAALPLLPRLPDVPKEEDDVISIDVGGDRDNQWREDISGLLQRYQRQKEEIRLNRERELATIRERKAIQQAEIDRIRAEKKDILEEDIQHLLAPFREELERAERQRLHIEENFFANQRSIEELESLLTQAQAEIRAEEAITGLAAIRQPRIAKKREEVAARVGVIEAVMAARNHQINRAFTLIDRSINSIEADRKSQLAFYKSIFDFYEAQRVEEARELTRLTGREEKVLENKIRQLEKELVVDRNVVLKVKEGMLNPAMANIYERAGVKLTDSLEEISQKLAIDAYNQEMIRINNEMRAQGFVFITPEQAALRPEDELFRMVDPRGNELIFWKEAEAIKEDAVIPIAEARRWGVPYGTTYEELREMGGIGPLVNLKKQIVTGKSEGMTREDAIKFFGPYGNEIIRFINKLYGEGIPGITP